MKSSAPAADELSVFAITTFLAEVKRNGMPPSWGSCRLGSQDLLKIDETKLLYRFPFIWREPWSHIQT